MSGWHRPDVETAALAHLTTVVGPVSARQIVYGLLARGAARAAAPLVVRWDRTVIQPDSATGETTVCCVAADGRPVALCLDDELREALGLLLVSPDAEGGAL